MEHLTHDEILKRKYLARGAGDEATKAYIASKYLGSTDYSSASLDKKKKKKKRKTIASGKTTVGNIGIIDEDDDSVWKQQPETEEADDTKDYDSHINVEDSSGGVFEGTAQNWQTIREGALDKKDHVPEEERPMLVHTEQEDKDAPSTPRRLPSAQDSTTPRMSNGQRAGVLTKEDIKREADRARQREQDEIKRIKLEQQGEDDGTVYRDASGRKIDPKQKRAEEARRRQEKIEREARKMEWGKGLVQREEAEKQKKRLEEEKHKPLARYADDQDLNEELRQQARWNDPAAGFLTNASSSSKEGKRYIKPTYKGPWKPNRFMIPPGYRWDGVDRSNGYEDKFLLQQNQAKSRAAEAFAWATEDM